MGVRLVGAGNEVPEVGQRAPRHDTAQQYPKMSDEVRRPLDEHLGAALADLGQRLRETCRSWRITQKGEFTMDCAAMSR